MSEVRQVAREARQAAHAALSGRYRPNRDVFELPATEVRRLRDLVARVDELVTKEFA